MRERNYDCMHVLGRWQLEKIGGKSSKDSGELLGYVGPQYVVDRNNIAMLVREKVGGGAGAAVDDGDGDGDSDIEQ